MKILAVGPLWRGSNAGGLFRALGRAGMFLEIVDEFYYISLQTRTRSTKILERFIRPLQVKEYNHSIISKIKVFNPDVVFVYKGAFVQPETLHYARTKGCKLALFYPDVSTTFHGPNIPKAIPIYDTIFTTKTFGITDMKQRYGIEEAHFVPHGFDPEIHRILKISDADRAKFGCDVSFIGTWSPKKEEWLCYLKKNAPGINLKIWGDQWAKCQDTAIKENIQYTAVLGDLYALAIQCSSINLGILSEKVEGASSGDLITSRTFHIPGTSGFMLHERNEESVLYYKENEEAGFFAGKEELTERVQYFLSNPSAREKMRLAGYQRALRDHSLDARAQTVLGILQKL